MHKRNFYTEHKEISSQFKLKFGAIKVITKIKCVKLGLKFFLFPALEQEVSAEDMYFSSVLNNIKLMSHWQTKPLNNLKMVTCKQLIESVQQMSSLLFSGSYGITFYLVQLILFLPLSVMMRHKLSEIR